MAAGSEPNPGTKYGPCVGGCEHKGCVESRGIAVAKCDLCKKPIGYDTLYFQHDNWTKFTHAECEWKEADERG